MSKASDEIELEKLKVKYEAQKKFVNSKFRYMFLLIFVTSMWRILTGHPYSIVFGFFGVIALAMFIFFPEIQKRNLNKIRAKAMVIKQRLKE